MAQSINVENLSKQYRIGQLLHETMLREAMVKLLKHPFRRQKSKKQTIWALKEVSFSVEEGEVVGIIGRNGAGKSTLLKVLSKSTYPTSGTIKIGGRVASLLEVGTGFHEELTGLENIYLNGSILGMSRKEINAKLDEIVDFAGVETFLDTPIKRYSSGMRLRLGFAVAAYLDPDILLVDEVLAVGDIDFQKKCLRAMDELRSGGRTVLFVSHNMAAIENLCNRALWIDGGRIHDDGDAREVIRSYLASFGNNEQKSVDLSRVESRSGSGLIHYTNFEFLDTQRTRKQPIRSGDSLVMRLFYCVTERVVNPHFGVKIYTQLGTLVTEVSTWGTGFEIPFLSHGEGYIDLEIKALNLMPGRYYLSLWIAGVGSLWYDVLEHCVVFDIESANIYSSGKGIASRHGIIFLACDWKFDSISRA